VQSTLLGRLFRVPFFELYVSDVNRTIVGLTSPLAETSNGNPIFLSEVAGLELIGVSSPPGTTEGEAAMLLGQLGFNGTFGAFVVSPGDPLPPGLEPGGTLPFSESFSLLVFPVPEPGTLSLAGLGVLMLAGLRRRRRSS
jgi:hypothetical protein